MPTVILHRGIKGDRQWSHPTLASAERQARDLAELHGNCRVRRNGTTFHVGAQAWYEPSKRRA